MFNTLNVSDSKKKIIVYIVLIAVTLIVYGQVTQYGFINFDDSVYVTENKYIRSGITLDTLCWSFTSKYFDLWNPLVWLSFMFDYQLYGFNGAGYHVTNLILHIFSTLLLFRLFTQMTNEIWKSAFVAALFALHPLHVESVAWIAERKDVLSAFFWMLTLVFYVYYTEQPGMKRYLLVLFSFILALMSKPMVITLPAIMILLDYWPLSRFRNRAELQKGNIFVWQLKEKFLFFALSGITVVINLYPSNSPYVGKNIPLIDRLANAPVSFMIYLEKTFWPYDMAVFYPFAAHIPLGQVLGTLLLIVMISLAVLAMMKRMPYLLVGWFWYTITLLPVIKLIQVGNDAMADRYHYLPSTGLAVMLAWGIPALFGNKKIFRKKILFPVTLAMLFIWAFIAMKQCSYWKNSISLFSHALMVTKENYLAHTNLANALTKRGDFNKAIYHYNKTIYIDPHTPIHYDNRGKAFAQLGKHELAIADFNKAISLSPYYADTYYNRGTSYAKTGLYQSAIDDFNKAIYLRPDYVNVYNNRGIVLHKLGLYEKAINDFNESLRLKPDHADARNNRAFTHLTAGNNQQGCLDAKKACKEGNCRALKWAQEKRFCN